MERSKISAVIITLNEEESLPRALASLSFCDEVVVVDSGSQDKTVEVAKALGARVLSHPWSGFGKQKRFATAAATHPWVLNIDADEVVSASLADEILQTLRSPTQSAYALPIHTFFMGKDMCLWGEKNGHIRLFDKRSANFGEEEVHEKVHVSDQRVGRLQGKILHHSYRNLDEYFHKFNLYTSKAALEAHQQGRRPPSMVLTLLRYKLRFAYLYIFRGGFTLGAPGLYWCLFSAFYTLVKHAKQRDRLTQGPK